MGDPERSATPRAGDAVYHSGVRPHV